MSNEVVEGVMEINEITKEFLLEHAGNEIGYSVITCNDRDFKEYARKASTICRRRFKAQEAVIISRLDAEEEGEAGIAFTTDALYYWEEADNFMTAVKYADIEAVDYDSNGIRIYEKGVGLANNDKDNSSDWDGEENLVRMLMTNPIKTITRAAMAGNGQNQLIPCVCYDWDLDEEEEQNYIREMYNFLCDILEELQ